MTTAEMIADVKRRCKYDLDLTPSIDVDGEAVDATDEDIVDFINQAQEELAEYAPIFDPAVTLTLPVIASGPCHLNLESSTVCSRKVFKVLDVVLNGRMLKTKLGNKPGPWSLAELEGDFPQWRTDSPSTPLRWARTSDTAIVLHPAPDSTQPASGNYVSAHVIPAELDAALPNGVSEMPESLHKHISRYATALTAETVATEGRQLQKCAQLKAEAIGAAQRKGARDRAAKSPLGSTSGRSKPDYLRI